MSRSRRVGGAVLRGSRVRPCAEGAQERVVLDVAEEVGDFLGRHVSRRKVTAGQELACVRQLLGERGPLRRERALEAALRGTQTVCGLVRRAFARGQHLDQDRPQARGRRLVGIELLQASPQVGGDALEHGVGAANERDRQVRGAEDKRICCAGFHWASQEIGVGRGNVQVGLLDVPLPIGVVLPARRLPSNSACNSLADLSEFEL